MSRFGASWNEASPWRELDSLIEAYSENTLDAVQAVRLEALLQENREAKQRFFGYLYLDGAMRWGSAVGVAESLPREWAEIATQRAVACKLPPKNQRACPAESTTKVALPLVSVLGRTWQKAVGRCLQPGAVSVLAAMLLMGTLLTLLAIWAAPSFRDWNAEVASPVPEAIAVAQLTELVDVEWGSGEKSWTSGSLIRQGESIVLSAGLVEVGFAEGANVIVEGPATFMVRDANACYLTYGKFIATVPSRATGFEVATPHVNIVDLGTQFGVCTEEPTGTEVNVLKGMVSVEQVGTSDSPTHTKVLDAGSAVRFGVAGNGEVTEACYAPDRFFAMVAKIARHSGEQPCRLLVENFDGYGSSNGTLAGMGCAGNGWAGGWIASTHEHNGNVDVNYVATTGLTFNNPDYTPVDNIESISDGAASQLIAGGHAGSTTYRNFAVPLTGTIWLSALVRYDSVDDAVLVWFHPSPKHSGNNVVGLFGTAGATATTVEPWIRYQGEMDESNDTHFAENTTYLYLVKIEIDYDIDGNDAITFWVKKEGDDLSNETTLGAPAYSKNGKNALGRSLQRVGISFNVSGGEILDNLRISNRENAFKDVVPNRNGG